MNIFLVIVFSILAGVAGRMGGSGKYPRQVRVVGVPFLCTLLAYILGCHNYLILFISMVLMVVAISTYWDFLFGYDNFWFHGFMLGIATAPIAYVTGEWIGFIALVAIRTVFIGLWCKFVGWDVAEEFGRYASLPLTTPLLFI